LSRYRTFREYLVQGQIEIWKEEIASRITTSKISKMIRETRRNEEPIGIWNEAIASKLTTSRLIIMIEKLGKN
jgi:hypothetical protein